MAQFEELMVGCLVSDVFLNTVEECEFFLSGGKRNAWGNGSRKRWKEGRRNCRSLR